MVANTMTTTATRPAHTPAAGRFARPTPSGGFVNGSADDCHQLPTLPSVPSLDIEEMLAAFPAEVSYGLEDFMALEDDHARPAALPSFDFSSSAAPPAFADDADAVVPQLPTISTPELSNVNLLAAELARGVVTTAAAAKPKAARRVRSKKKKKRKAPNATANAADLGLTSTGHPRKRRPKQAVPDVLKDEKYWARRRANNLAAKKNRDRKRQERLEQQQRVQSLDTEKAHLQDEAELLQKELAALRELVRKRLTALA